jgi:hypothetical protein
VLRPGRRVKEEVEDACVLAGVVGCGMSGISSGYEYQEDEEVVDVF